VTFPQEYTQIVEFIEKEKKEPVKAEEEVLGINHAEIGAFLMRQWNLPERLIEAVEAHHNLSKAKEFKKEAAVVHLADVLIHARGYGESLYKKVPPLDEKAFKILKLDFSFIKELFFKLEPKLYELKFFTEELKKETEVT
ncbi:MAG TPA: HD family phosphohydrolase, partial [Thermodesulfobacterium commune]|nr:HD family phosphohydrolase [Thermodesulfobacterium commune]